MTMCAKMKLEVLTSAVTLFRFALVNGFICDATSFQFGHFRKVCPTRVPNGGSQKGMRATVFLFIFPRAVARAPRARFSLLVDRRSCSHLLFFSGHSCQSISIIVKLPSCSSQIFYYLIRFYLNRVNFFTPPRGFVHLTIRGLLFLTRLLVHL